LIMWPDLEMGGPDLGIGRGTRSGVLFGEEQRYSSRVAERRTLKLR